MKVLIADDDPVSRRILEKSLYKWGYDVVTACCGSEASKALASDNAPQIAILDWMMPGFNGIEICRQIRTASKEPYTYLVLLTAKHSKADLVAGLESGADDYLSKPFEPQELKVRLDNGRRILELMSQLMVAREKLREMAMRDVLTGLSNRAGILNGLDVEFDRARRQGSRLSLILLDLDRFKTINDSYGHRVGDEALQATAHTIERSIRTYDRAGRYGGEEFLIVLPDCDEENAVGLAERLRAAIAQTRLRTSLGEISISASFGVAAVEVGFGFDKDYWVDAADAALYRAKNNGRNQVVVGTGAFGGQASSIC